MSDQERRRGQASRKHQLARDADQRQAKRPRGPPASNPAPPPSDEQKRPSAGLRWVHDRSRTKKGPLLPVKTLEKPTKLGYIVPCTSIVVLEEDLDRLLADASNHAVEQTVVQKKKIEPTIQRFAQVPEQLQAYANRIVRKRLLDTPQSSYHFVRDRTRRTGIPSARATTYMSNMFLPNQKTSSIKFNSRAFCAKYSADGSMFVTATQDSKIHVYDTTSTAWRKTKEITARDIGWSVIDVDFSPDKRFVIYSSWSDSVQLANATGENVLHEPLNFDPVDTCCMFGIKFDPTGRQVLAGMNQGHVAMYDIEHKRRLCLIQGHTDDVNDVCFANEGRTFLTASDDYSCRVWDYRLLGATSRKSRPQFVGGFVGHMGGLTSVEASADGRYIVTNGKDQVCKLWDMRKMSSPAAVRQHQHKYSHINADYDYRRHNFPQTIPRCPDHSLQTFAGHSVHHTLIRSQFSPDFTTGEQYIVSGSACGRVFVYDILSGDVVDTLLCDRSVVREVSWHPYDNVIAAACWNNSVDKFEYVAPTVC